MNKDKLKKLLNEALKTLNETKKNEPKLDINIGQYRLIQTGYIDTIIGIELYEDLKREFNNKSDKYSFNWLMTSVDMAGLTNSYINYNDDVFEKLLPEYNFIFKHDDYYVFRDKSKEELNKEVDDYVSLSEEEYENINLFNLFETEDTVTNKEEDNSCASKLWLGY